MNITNRQDALTYIKSLLDNHIVTADEVRDILAQQKTSNRFANLLYYIGAGIIFFGIFILLWQNWNTLSNITKIVITLGSGIAAYIMAILYAYNKSTEQLSSAFFCVAGLALPLGIAVVFDITGLDVDSPLTQCMISAILFSAFMLSYWIHRKNLLLVFSIIFATWLFFGLGSFFLDGHPIFDNFTFFAYQVLIAGLSYIVLGYYFASAGKSELTGALYGFGICGFLGAAYALGGIIFIIDKNVMWELLFPILIFATLYFSVFLRSKSFLVFSTLYLMLFIIRTTLVYFLNSVNWPVLLVLIGFLLIAAGYGSFYVNKKYLK
jgi:hypothetical protein